VVDTQCALSVWLCGGSIRSTTPSGALSVWLCGVCS